MYLLPIQVPIHLDGTGRTFVSTEWKRSLELLRDSLAERFGPITVLAPSLPASAAGAAQALEELTGRRDGIELVPSFDKRTRLRDFVLRHRRQWLAQLRGLIKKATVVHAGLDDLYRPLAWSGFVEATKANKLTVFVQDTDIALQQRELAQSARGWRKWRARAYARRYAALCENGVAAADLSLLKGSRLMLRYGPHGKNPHEFQDTSYLSTEIVPPDTLESRLATLNADRPIRLVYCGRLIPRKGLDHALRIVHAANRPTTELPAPDGGSIPHQAFPNFTLDLIGAGPEAPALQSLAADLRAQQYITFHPPVRYNGALLSRLAQYDALFFTPLAEDTPRMIFDGYAAGLPLLAYDIDYVKERATEGATILLPRNDILGSAMRLAALRRSELAALARRARDLADHHAADAWYRRRAQWTFEAADRKNRDGPSPRPKPPPRPPVLVEGMEPRTTV